MVGWRGNMIDLHSHILPGVDDGAKTMADAIEMARSAVAAGFEHIVSTPHFNSNRLDVRAEDATKARVELQEQLDAVGIPLTIHPGHEIHGRMGWLERWQAGEAFALADSRYILFEHPFDHMPDQAEEWVHETLVLGKVPIIAHPERNAEIQHNPERYIHLIRQGALGQLTIGSLVGVHGPRAMKTARMLCERQAVHVWATDAHNNLKRSYKIQEALEVLQQMKSADIMDLAAYGQQNAAKVLADQAIEPFQPLSAKPSRLGKLWNKSE